MRYTEITWHTVWGAVRHQWKLFLLTMAVFMLVGGTASFLYARHSPAEPEGSAAALNAADYTDIVVDEQYYYACGDRLTAAYDSARQYLTVLKTDSTLSAAQKASLEESGKQLNTFSQTRLQGIQSALGVTETLYIPASAMEAAADIYTEKLQVTQRSLVQAQNAVDILKGVSSQKLPIDTSAEDYQKLLDTAALLGDYQNAKQIYAGFLDQLSNQADTTAQRSSEMESRLRLALGELNPLIDSISQKAVGIAGENHLNITVKYDTKNTATVVVNHTHRGVSAKENIKVLLLFCTLIGAWCGVFLCICQEGRRELHMSRSKRIMNRQHTEER